MRVHVWLFSSLVLHTALLWGSRNAASQVQLGEEPGTLEPTAPMLASEVEEEESALSEPLSFVDVDVSDATLSPSEARVDEPPSPMPARGAQRSALTSDKGLDGADDPISAERTTPGPATTSRPQTLKNSRQTRPEPRTESDIGSADPRTSPSDWLSIGDQLDETERPASPQTVRHEPDPFVERLMEAERRKRATRLSEARRLVPVRPTPSAAPGGPEAARPSSQGAPSEELGDVLAYGIATALPLAARDDDPMWSSARPGPIERIQFRVRVVNHRLELELPSHVHDLTRTLLRRTMALLSRGRVSISAERLPSGVRSLELELLLTRPRDATFRLLREPLRDGKVLVSQAIVHDGLLLEGRVRRLD